MSAAQCKRRRHNEVLVAHVAAAFVDHVLGKLTRDCEVVFRPLTNQERAKIQTGGSFFMALDGCSQERFEHFFLQTPD